MRTFSLFFLLGTLLVQFLDRLPSLLFLLFIAFSIALILVVFIKNSSVLFKKILLAILALFFGFCLTSVTADNQLKKRLSAEYEGKNIVLTGLIEGIPDNRKDGIRFRLNIDKAFLLKKHIKIGGVVKLGWYQDIQQLKAGEIWQLEVRLKQPSGFMNPGGFDYEKWLFSERIIATGYVRKSENNQRIAEASTSSINHLRENIHRSILEKLQDKPSAAVLSALMVAVRSDLDDSQWKILQKTGTSHLIAISGLHIAIVAGFAFFPIMLFWRLFPSLNERIPLTLAGSVASVIMATCYSLLAGFTLPTQRALLMVVVMLISLVLRKNYKPFFVLSVAILLVLLFDPLAAMTISFWLSFAAVALILIINQRQKNKPAFQLLRMQLILSLGMLPLTLFFFGVGSLSAPIANLFAIPWVSFLIVPVGILGVICMPFSEVLSGLFFELAALAIKYLFKGLELVSALPVSDISAGSVSSIYFVLLAAGLLFLILPKGFPARWLGLIAIMPVFLLVDKKPEYGAFQYSLLDVGQGMASVIHTKSHTIIYDVGTRVSSSYDMGKLVVVPYLKHKGVSEVNMMVLSHNNLDHRGGAPTILKELDVRSIVSSDLNILSKFPKYKIERCVAGMSWQWDGVDFKFISPELEFSKKLKAKDNNLSCVLRVSNNFHSLLLTGDIQKKAERTIIKNNNALLAAEVITMPHHGSKTSSSLAFLEIVSPALAVIPVGYKNRFGHPKAEVLKRYSKQGIAVMDTVNAGEIEIMFSASKDSFRVNSYRQSNQHFWNREVRNQSPSQP